MCPIYIQQYDGSLKLSKKVVYAHKMTIAI